MNDQQILALLREGKRSQAFLLLYKGYPSVEKLILSNGGSKEDAKDVFQDALLIFYQKVKNSQFDLRAAISTYLYSVCRFIWSDELKKRNKKAALGFEIQLESNEREELQQIRDKESKFKQVELVLTQIGEKCLQLLKMFYYEGLSMKEIARNLEFNSENVAKTQKYKCLEKAKQKLKESKSLNSSSNKES